MRLVTTLAVLCVTFVGGCATTSGPPKHIMGVQDDKFSQNITIAGGAQSVNPFGGTSCIWFIRSWIDKKTYRVTHQLYVDISYRGDWRFFQMAADDRAKALRVT